MSSRLRTEVLSVDIGLLYLQKDYPGTSVPQSTIDMINNFLDWAQQQQDGEQLGVKPYRACA